MTKEKKCFINNNRILPNFDNRQYFTKTNSIIYLGSTMNTVDKFIEEYREALDILSKK